MATGEVMREKSKTVATWLALVVGAFGLHRLYLRGPHQVLAWLHAPITLLGLLGVQRMQAFGQDDRASWFLIPLLGLMVSQGALHAIVYGLTSDEAWQQRHNPSGEVRATHWAPVFGVIAALLVGGAVLMGTIAFSGQRFFEWQLAR
jgi:hypothetical protein